MFVFVVLKFWAKDGTWTHDLFLTKEVLYRWATSALCFSIERKTRFELATYSLEGYRSTNWATSALKLWGEKDSNLRSRSNGFTVRPIWPLWNLPKPFTEPPIGIEPMTYWLQVSCSTSWAKEAFNLFDLKPKTLKNTSLCSKKPIRRPPKGTANLHKLRVEQNFFWKKFRQAQHLPKSLMWYHLPGEI